MNKTTILSSLLLIATLASGCGQNGASFSLLPSTSNFQQAGLTKNKLDILWVIDNSGSMDSSQQALGTNIRRFMDLFNTRGYDYQMAVTTTDAYKEFYGSGPQQSRFRDGTDQTSHTGVYVVGPTTPDMVNTFVTNAMQGIYGSGDERAFSSFQAALNNPMNSGFPRAGAFLAVIILSDEDDFSGSSSTQMGYNDAGLYPIDNFVSYLDGLTGATADNRIQKYSVNTIGIFDQQCLNQLNAQTPGRRIGVRYQSLATATNGIVGSLCGDFGATLATISAYILNAVTEFFLSRQPNVATLRVYVNGVAVPQVADPSGDGYMYNPDRNSIKFYNAAIPGPSDKVSVTFDPSSIM